MSETITLWICPDCNSVYLRERPDHGNGNMAVGYCEGVPRPIPYAPLTEIAAAVQARDDEINEAVKEMMNEAVREYGIGPTSGFIVRHGWKILGAAAKEKENQSTEGEQA